MKKRVFIIADHGMAIVYFLQSDVVQTLLEAGVEVILLTDDEIKGQIEKRFVKPGLCFEGLRLKQANDYYQSVDSRLQWLLIYLRRVGGSSRINTEALDSHIWEVWKENSWKFRLAIWMPAAFLTFLLRHSTAARKALVRAQMRFTPDLYEDLFEKYEPDLVIASTAGWRMDRYLLREANRHGIPTMAAIVGWDNPSSYTIPGAPVDWATCWSDIQKDELVLGSDWQPDRINIGGIPSYDGYLKNAWLMPKDEYFRAHGLDPSRKLIAYACSFVHFAPNYPNVKALAKLVASDQLSEPSQLLVRLHPSHFQDKPKIFAGERERIYALEKEYPNVHVVRPVPLGGSLGYYSGEDMPEKTSMMVHSDVFVTVFSTMVVECAIHDTPIVSSCIDVPGGWNTLKKYSLALKKIGNWPTHQRFREAGAGRLATNETELCEAINFYLQDPRADAAARRSFVKREISYVDGSAGKRTAEFILSVLDRKP